MKVTIILSVCFLAFAETSRRQSGSLLRKTGRCGKVLTSIPSARIIGGSDAVMGKWPWQAMIKIGLDEDLCGGSLIGSQWVLTAAHCFDDTRDPSQTKIALGAHFLDLSGSNVRMFNASEVLCHKDYNETDDTIANDICLVKLASEVTYTDYIFPIRLPSSSNDNVTVGKTCVITGWGDTRDGGECSSILQQAYIDVFSRQNCIDWYGEDNDTIPNGTICAGTRDASKGICEGDSGGPLACNRSEGSVTMTNLYGITSFSATNCSKPERPGVFTGVANYLDWIKETTRENGVNVCYSLPSIQPCGSVIKKSRSRIRSPIADNTSWLYPGDVDCSWTVQAPAGYVVKIEFLCYFGTGNDCQDYLEINSTNGKGVRYSCGVSDTPETYIASGNQVTMTFHSDSDSNVGQGFVVQAVFDGAETCRCSLIALLLPCLVFFLS